MAVSHDLPVSGEALQRLFFQHAFIAGQIVEYGGIENHETDIHPRVHLRLLAERKDLIILVGVNDTETGNRPNGRHGRNLSMPGMELQRGGNIDVGYSVAI